MTQEPQRPRASALLVLFRGLTRRCPSCGERRLFRRWLHMVTECPRCGLVLEREEGAFLGSLAINYGVTGLALIAYLIVILVVTLPDPPIAALTIGAVGVAVVLPLIVYPFAKTTWAAIDLLMHPRSN